jgi:hypothetical protein
MSGKSPPERFSESGDETPKPGDIKTFECCNVRHR